ncbi:MAG TPA: hypothetical protein PK431_12690 [Chitinophagales bacterium]|nr:hypothetical protein [Chitinophagales bacterium]
MDAKRFLPECDIDTLLVHTILQSKIIPNHKKNINKVVHAMNEDYTDRFCVGIVDIVKDFDKHKKNFSEIANSKDQVVLYKNDNSNQFIVYIKNGVEKFIWNNCQELEVDLTQFNLPNVYEQLVQITKHPLRWSNEQKENFRLLFKHLIKQENTGFYNLAIWLRYLYEKAEESKPEEINQLI